MQTRSRVAAASFRLGILAAVLFVGPPAAVQVGVASSRLVFLVFMLGGLLGLAAFAVGLVGLYRTRASSGRSGRGLALRGTAIGGAILLVVLIVAGPTAGVPPINDITTNTSDPPRFVAALSAEANRDRDMSYPGQVFAVQQIAGYPDLAPIELEAPPSRVLGQAERAMREFGWAIARSDPDAGALEATDTSRIFRFVDDIVVRVRPRGAGSVVDVRSKSREGRSDLGANASRIRRLRDALGG